MKVLMLSIDSKVFEKNSAVRERMVEYGQLFDALHVVVYTKPGFVQEEISENTILYPTNSKIHPLYFLDAHKICKSFIEKDFVVTSQEAMTNLLAVFLKWRFGTSLQVQIHTDFMSLYFQNESLLNRARVIMAKFLIP